MTENTRPWHRREIFHDEVASYPLDCFSLIGEAEAETEKTKEAKTEEAGRD